MLQSENLFDQNLIDLLKTTDKLQLKKKKNLMRVSKSIHVTTDNSFEDEALALDNRSDSVAQRHKVGDSNSKVWRTTVKKSSK